MQLLPEDEHQQAEKKPETFLRYICLKNSCQGFLHQQKVGVTFTWVLFAAFIGFGGTYLEDKAEYKISLANSLTDMAQQDTCQMSRQTDWLQVKIDLFKGDIYPQNLQPGKGCFFPGSECCSLQECHISIQNQQLCIDSLLQSWVLCMLRGMCIVLLLTCISAQLYMYVPLCIVHFKEVSILEPVLQQPFTLKCKSTEKSISFILISFTSRSNVEAVFGRDTWQWNIFYMIKKKVKSKGNHVGGGLNTSEGITLNLFTATCVCVYIHVCVFFWDP